MRNMSEEQVRLTFRMDKAVVKKLRAECKRREKKLGRRVPLGEVLSELCLEKLEAPPKKSSSNHA